MRLRRRTAFVLCLIVLFSYEAYALFVRESGLTAHEPQPRDLHLTREINADTPLSQSFVTHAEGFRGVELFARPSDQPPVGPLEVAVMQETDAGWRVISRSRIDVASIDLAGSVMVTTPRVDQTAGAVFRVDVTMPQAAPGHGLRFQAGGPTYVQGVMTIGGRQEWGDLKFRTRADRSTVLRHLRYARQRWPAPFQSDVLWVCALLFINWALATVVYYLAFAPEAFVPEALANGSALTTADQPRV